MRLETETIQKGKPESLAIMTFFQEVTENVSHHSGTNQGRQYYQV